MRPLYLIGFMGTGKSTVALALAELLGTKACDMDEEITRRIGMPISAYFETEGEARFREREHEVLEELSEELSAAGGGVISCGGGVVLRADNLACMKAHGTTVLLTAEPQTILQRVGQSDHRPLLRGKKDAASIAAMMEERLPFYEKAADHRVATDQKTPEEIAGEIVKITENAGLRK